MKLKSLKKWSVALTMLTAIAPLGAKAQQTSGPGGRSLYVELLGASNLVGVNYDARFKSGSPWGYRVGVGYTYSSQYNMFTGSNSLRGADVPLEINYLLGKKRSKLDLGFGLNLGYYTEKYDVWNVVPTGEPDGLPYYEAQYAGEDKHSQWGYFFFGNIGYRYQPARGFQFRAGLSPSFNLGGSHAVSKGLFPYVSFGYAF